MTRDGGSGALPANIRQLLYSIERIHTRLLHMTSYIDGITHLHPRHPSYQQAHRTPDLVQQRLHGMLYRRCAAKPWPGRSPPWSYRQHRSKPGRGLPVGGRGTVQTAPSPMWHGADDGHGMGCGKIVTIIINQLLHIKLRSKLAAGVVGRWPWAGKSQKITWRLIARPYLT